MVLFNHATREMTAKIVYYGPGLCGKTTNLMVVFDKLDPKSKGKMLSLATKTDRTLFFDLLPVDIGKVGNFNLKIQLYTVPGQVFYNETRKLVLRGADSVVFVCDSQPSMIESNRESFANLMDNLKENQIDIDDTPIVIQFNKRDIPGVLPIEKLQSQLGLEGYPYAEAAAIKGEGVMETFKLVSKITAKHLFNRLKGGKSEPIKRGPVSGAVRPPAAAPAPAAPKARVAPLSPFKPSPSPEPELPPLTPFPDTAPLDSAPFPEDSANPLDAGYEKMEEVSLEQLLEGRERPATFAGAVVTPIVEHDEVEELDAESMVHDSPAVAVLDPPSRASSSSSSGDTQQLRQQIQTLREEHRRELESILRELNDLASRVRSKLS